MNDLDNLPVMNPVEDNGDAPEVTDEPGQKARPKAPAKKILQKAQAAIVREEGLLATPTGPEGVPSTHHASLRVVTY